MKVRFHCVMRLDAAHDVDVKLSDMIISWPPSCCGRDMVPLDGAELRRIVIALNRANRALTEAGLPNLVDLLRQAWK